MTKKSKNNGQFPEYILQCWEANDCVNFAIALSRMTGWILHIDWWTPTNDKEVVENMKPLRVHVGNNSNQVYDIRGRQTISTYTNNILMPIFKKRALKNGGIVTRYYSEQKLFDLPLRIKPNETKIQEAIEFINRNILFLNRIPLRNDPKVPADIAAKFTFGSCNPFATALCDLRGYKAVAIIAKEYNRIFDNNRLGYVHSFVLDQDNKAIDVWGKDNIENIAQRFEIAKYEISESEHVKVNQRYKVNSLELYNILYEESVAIINEYF
jgi:hypothetical protein